MSEEMVTNESIKQIYCLRVSQLDTKLLDNELFSNIESKLNDLETEELKQLRPELLALIKSYVWLNTVHKNGISIGQSLLQLKYYDFSSKDCIRNINTIQKNCLIFNQILFPLIKHRINWFTKNTKFLNLLEFTENTYKTFDFINSLLFLYYGKYRSLWERIFKLGTGVQTVNQKTNSSELYFEIMTRELLWNAFSEFLTFMLPLINFYRLRNTFNNFLRTLLFRPSHQIHVNPQNRDLTDLSKCQICNDWPINGHEIGCRHVFCYYCLMSNFMSDQINGFTCNKCFYKISSKESIKRVKVYIN